MLRKIAMATAGVCALSGCASIGQDEYSCPGVPQGVRCTATRDLYSATNGGEAATAQMVSAAAGADPSASSQPASDRAEPGDLHPLTDPVIDTFVTPNLPDRPVPIRTPSQVMRIWMASWEDADTGALIAPGYIYTEIEPRRWVIGRPDSAASQQGRLIKPLESSGNAPQNAIPLPEKE